MDTMKNVQGAATLETADKGRVVGYAEGCCAGSTKQGYGVLQKGNRKQQAEAVHGFMKSSCLV